MADGTGGTSSLSGANISRHCPSSATRDDASHIVSGVLKRDVIGPHMEREIEHEDKQENSSGDDVQLDTITCLTDSVVIDRPAIWRQQDSGNNHHSSSPTALTPSPAPPSSLVSPSGFNLCSSPSLRVPEYANNTCKRDNHVNHQNRANDSGYYRQRDYYAQAEENGINRVSKSTGTTRSYNSVSTLNASTGGRRDQSLHRSCSLSSPDDWTIEHIAEDRHAPQRYTLGNGPGVHSLAWTSFDGLPSESRFTFETTSTYESSELWRSFTPPPFPIHAIHNNNNNNADLMGINGQSGDVTDEAKGETKRKKKERSKRNDKRKHKDKKKKKEANTCMTGNDNNYVHSTEDDHGNDDELKMSAPKTQTNGSSHDSDSASGLLNLMNVHLDATDGDKQVDI